MDLPPRPPGSDAGGRRASALEHAMLVRALVRPGSGIDVEQILAELPDAPDSESVEEGFLRAVRRWPELSAFFAWEGLPTPEKRIAGTGEALDAFPFESHDWRSLDEEEAEERSRAWLAQDRRRGFRLDRPPLFRVAYFRLAAGARVVWTFHHLLADGRSFEPVLAEALRVRRSADGSDRKDEADGVRGEGVVADVDPVTLDTDTDTDTDADADAARSACAFWSEALSGFDGPTPLALANATVETQASAPGEVERRLSSEESRSLERLAADAGVSASTIAAAAWAVVLARTSAEDDVVIGVVGSGRSAADAGRVGLFIRTLPLRTDVPRRGPVLPWLSDLRRRQLGAREHERVSLSDIAGWLGRPGDRPLFETLVVFDREDLSARLARRGGVWTERRFRLIENTGEALTLYATAGDAWTLRLAWDRNRFEERGASRMADALVHVLRRLARDGDRADFASLPLLSEDEKRQVLDEWNRTDAPLSSSSSGHGSARSALSLIEERSSRDPDRTAVVCGSEEVSYRTLRARARGVAAALAKKGVSAGDAVGVCAERRDGVAMLAALLGVWKTGASYVPLDPDYPAERLAAIARDAGLAAVATTEAAAGRLPETLAPRVLLEFEGDGLRLELPRTETGEPGPGPAGPDALAYVLYTSGSTGRPKGVEVTHGNLLAFFAGMDGVIGPSRREDPVWLALTSISFDISVLELFWTLANGFRVVVPPYPARELSFARPRGAASPDASIPALIERHRVTHLQCTPTFAAMLVAERESRAALAGLEALLVGGEALSPGLADSLAASVHDPGRVLNMYGPTETTVWSTSDVVTEGDPPTIGRPIANTRAYVLDTAGQPLPPGVPGELYLGGAGVARGYRGLPEQTAERFLTDPFRERRDGSSGEPMDRMYRTGDRVRWSDDGRLEFLGRFDDQVKIRGHRVEPGEIEAALGRRDDLREVAVVAREIDGELRLVAYVAPTGNAGAEPSAGELERFLRTELPEAMRPSRWVVMPSLPRTPNGKLDRRALPAPASAESDAAGRARLRSEESEESEESEKSEDPVVRELTRIWSGVLGVDSIDPDDDFFELGGHSLLALRLLASVTSRLGILVPLRALFDAPRFSDFAAAVRAAGAERTASPSPSDRAPARPPDRSDPFPLTDTQQAYWIGRTGAFELGNVSTHTYVEIDVPHLDVGHAQTALDLLIARHDMLRARVLPDGRQQILESVPSYRIEVLDLRGLPEEEADAQLDRTRERLSTRPIAPDRWPLFEVRATLLEGCVRIHVKVDHLIVDALSWRILRRELVHLYRRGAAGTASLPELDFTFRDYVLDEVSRRDSPERERAREYWRSRLETLPPAPDLPLAKRPSAVGRPRMTRRRGHLPTASWRRFKARARRTGVTGTGALLASFADVLAAWSRSPRMTINVPGFRRRPVHPHVHDIVGVFTSLTLLELDGSDGEFAERARRIQRRLWEDLDHSAYTGVEVIRDLSRAQKPMAGAPLPASFPVVFTSLLFAGDAAVRDRSSVRPGEPSAEVVFEINQSPQVWLSAEVAEEGGGLAYWIDAVDELFPDGLLEDLFAAWGRRIDALAREPEAWREDAAATGDSLLPAWQREARERANSTDGPVASVRLEELFDRTLAAPGQSERIAVVARDRDGTYHELTYAELDRRADWVAAALSAAGVVRGERVAVAMEKGWETAAAVLGILRAGAAYLPLEPGLPADRLSYLARNAAVRVALTTRAVRTSFAFPEGVRVIEVDPSSADGASAIRSHRSRGQGQGQGRGPSGDLRSADDVAYVLYTSGSTGQPKGVVISHRAAVNTVLDVNERFGLGAEDRILGLSALGFDLSVWDLFGAFAAGAAVVLPEEAALKDPARWLDPIERAGVTVWDSVPALMKLFLESAGARVGERAEVARRLRLVMLSGDWTPVTLPDEIRRVFPDARIVSLGGATEASIWSIAFPIDRVDPAWRSIPYGRPLRNQRFHVLDRALAPRPVWVPGDLHIAGAGLALGYLADEEKTRASFFGHPRTGERLYRTGDLGRYLPDGTIEFLGRDDRQVKVLGTRMELGEIETALADHPGVASAMVTAYGEWNRHLCAYVVPRRRADEGPGPDDRVDAGGLRAHLAARLPAAMVPEAYVLLPELPLTANGKVDRSALPRPAERPTEPAPIASVPVSMGPSAGPIEVLAAAVAGILRVPAVDADDNLIDLGANSVDFIRIANLVEKTCGRRPPFDEIYREPTVAAIVRAASRASEDEVPLLAGAFPGPAGREGRIERWEGSE